MGKNLVFVPECHSTNTLAHELSQLPSTADGSIVITLNQTAGKGQRGNTWATEPGKNLTFSIILKPAFLAIKDQFFLNIFTSLGVHDFLKNKINTPIHVKWPNDILVNGRKICGILIENQIKREWVINTIIGIGLNINQMTFPFVSATSLAAETGSEAELTDALSQLVGCLEARYLQLRAGNYSELKQHYLNQLYRKGENHVFVSNGESFDGVINGIDEAGRLQVSSKDGLKAYQVKEISYT